MTNSKIALLCVVTGMSLPVLTNAAIAQDVRQGTYLSLGGGANFSESSGVDYTNTPTAATTAAPTSFDTGYILSGAFGYRWGSGLRTEVEYNFRKSGVDHIAGVDASGKQRVHGLMANILYDFGEHSSFRPYVGGGIGAGWNRWSNVRGNPSATFPTGTALFTDTDRALQWQAIGGVSRPFTEKVEGFVEYRYIGLENNKFTGAPAAVLANHHDDRSHNILAGVRYAF
jgi:OOP family OmpA-OmpF porin